MTTHITKGAVKNWRTRQAKSHPVQPAKAIKAIVEPYVIYRTCADCHGFKPAKLQRMIPSQYYRRWFWRCLPCHARALSWEMNYQAQELAS